MPNEVVTGRQLEKVHPGGVRAIDFVDLSVTPGKITALVGRNGAGKTTLLGMLAGVIAPTSGEVELLGVRQPASHPASLRRLQTQLAYVDQDAALDPEMTGRETLRLMAALYRVESVDELADRFGLSALLSRQVGSWSGGQKRRLHLVCALLHTPRLIFLDEPTAGLDGEGTRLLWAELDRRAQAGATVLLAGHDLAEIEREAAQVIILDRGKIVAAGSPAELIAAHAGTWLRVTLRDPSALATVEALPGFSHATLEGRRLWVQVDDPRRLGELVAAVAVADVVVHRRDLAGVYRTLTGGELEGRREGRGRK